MSGDVEKIQRIMEPFYLRFYSGGYREDATGHEFIEFDIRVNEGSDYAVLRYANQSNYRDEDLIQKRVSLSPSIVHTFVDLMQRRNILDLDNSTWDKPSVKSKVEVEIRHNGGAYIFKTKEIGSISYLRDKDPSLSDFYHFTQDLKSLVFSLISLHFKTKPLGV